MDEIIKIIGIGLIALVIVVILKQYRPEFAVYISLIAGVLILYIAMDKFNDIINLLQSISNKAGINRIFLEILLKITGIAFLSEFAVSICKDSGESAIATKIELGSKVIIISMSIPIISNLMEMVQSLYGTTLLHIKVDLVSRGILYYILRPKSCQLELL